MNRFTNCKSLEDLYNNFSEDTFSYNNVSVEELETVAEVFKANVDIREMPDTPLTDKGYTYILNYVIDTVQGRDMEAGMEEAMMANIINNKEAEVEMSEKFNAFKKAQENLKEGVNETYEEFIERADESFNILKDGLMKALGVLDTMVGYTTLKGAIIDMIDSSTVNGSSRKDLFKMSKRCVELIEQEIEDLNDWGDEESLKDAIKLKSLTEGVRGKSVFEAFTVGVIWIAKRIFRKLKIKSADDKKTIFRGICKGISAFAQVLGAGLVIVWTATKFVLSFVISGVVILGELIYRGIKTAIEKIKTWNNIRKNKINSDDDLDDDLDDDSDGVFGTNLA